MRGELPNAGGLTYLALISIALCLAGMAWYQRASYKFADEV